MSTWQSLLLAVAVIAAVYGVFVASLVVAGRRGDAAALARFIPDCIVLFRRLITDRRVPSGRKLMLVVLVAYLVMPFDLISDFIPVAGILDDAILVGVVLRIVLRGSGGALITEHWPGSAQSRSAVLRFAGAAPANAAVGRGPRPDLSWRGRGGTTGTQHDALRIGAMSALGERFAAACDVPEAAMILSPPGWSARWQAAS
ncbi:MAG: DUF1232 domain-containing protein [Actinobacteria bacterium]|nr:DUF1232 domain-containing protein [Actinomycetota bacterium]